jgi:lipid II isoglutaminyl synthase (glutamine-hydrolysing)
VSDQPGVRVCALYADVLNGVGDGGNLVVLERRCRWRHLPFRLVHLGMGAPLRSDDHDLYVIGGGDDEARARCAGDLVATKGPALHAAVARGAAVLGVGAGFQLLGRHCDTGSGTLPGAGLLDVRTTAASARLVGDVVVEDRGRRLVGFENHRGRTWLGPDARPLGRVVRGHGNNGEDGTEGARQGSVVGTHLHGPVLARNVRLADELLAAALGVDALPPLDDRLEDLAHESVLRVARR